MVLYYRRCTVLNKKLTIKYKKALLHVQFLLHFLSQ